MKREIEIKCLLANEEERDQLVQRIGEIYPAFKQIKSDVVIISYFYKSVESAEVLLDAAKMILRGDDYEKLEILIAKSDDLSVKVRSINNEVSFAVKGAARGEDAVHAVNRIEFEVVVDSPLEDLSDELIGAGIELASKWSSKRDFYELDAELEMNIEFVAGYGYKAEIEILIEDDQSEKALKRIRESAKKLGLVEASQELFGNMYEYYNAHWQEYFDTEKVFPDEVWRELGRDI